MLKRLSLISLLSVALGFSPVQANTDTRLVINSNMQEVQQTELGELVSVFFGNVNVSYGNGMNLKANKIVVTDKNGKRSILATGAPVTVVYPERQFQLKSNEVVFNLTDNTITAKNAEVKYLGNSLVGKNVVYNLNTNSVRAVGNPGKQVETIINNLGN